MLQRFLLLLSLCALSSAAAQDSLLWNHVGYERTGPKTAVVKNSGGGVSTMGFQLLNASGVSVFQGTASPSSQVPGWGTTNWKVLDFSKFLDSGSFCLKTIPGGLVSETFAIGDELLLRQAGPAVLSFFNSMRNADAGDHKIGYQGQSARGAHDVFGGWNDATGDDGKYLSHLSYANFMNPQQIPMVIWSLLRTAELAPKATASWSLGLRAEAAWGADYLLRVLDTQGYFYINVFDRWGASTRTICSWIGDSASQGNPTSDYQAGWREGGGMAIAALALAAKSGISGDSANSRYLENAIRAFDTLSARKGRWDDDGQENLIDHYCALLAAVELYRATGTQRYLDAAGARADSIVCRQQPDGWLLSDNGARPFFHGVDEGLPLIALNSYLEIDPSSPRSDAIRAMMAKSIQWYHSLTRGVANPFVYPRMFAPDAPTPGSVVAVANLALKSTVTASSTQVGYVATDAVDGSPGSRWGSSLTDSLAWIMVDLGKVSILDSIALDWENAYAKQYEIQLSLDGTNWKKTFPGGATGPGWNGLRLSEDTARYVRMQGQVRGTTYGYSIWEFQVFGTLPPTPPVTNAPSSKRFFMPHKNETNYWWQGENARLGSMSTALILAGRAAQPGWTLSPTDSLSQEAVAGLDWVSGKNALGYNFLFQVNGGNYANYFRGPNKLGGICNGITANSDIDQSPKFVNDGSSDNWRWVEQWLPHDANYLLGIASVAHMQEVPPDLAIHPVTRVRPVMSITSGSGRIRASLSSSADWILRDPWGRIEARRWGVASVEFTPGPGTWIVEARAAGGTRQAKMAVLP